MLLRRDRCSFPNSDSTMSILKTVFVILNRAYPLLKVLKSPLCVGNRNHSYGKVVPYLVRDITILSHLLEDKTSLLLIFSVR